MPIIKVKDVIDADKALDEQQGAQLFKKIYAALILPRQEKVVVDFEGITEVGSPFLAAGLTALIAPFKGNDLAANLEIVNLSQVYLALLQKLNDAYRAKRKEMSFFEGLCHEVSF